MSYKVVPLPESHASLGEGPHWDISSQSLYYVDIDTATLLRYDYKENKVYRAKIEGEDLAGFVIPIEGENNQFAVGCGRRVQIVSWDGISDSSKVVRTLFEVEPEEKFSGNRFNDGKCDPQGRLFAGTMFYKGDEFSQRLGYLYKYENGNVSIVKGDVGISNGLAWDEKTKKFYYTDTTDFEVKAYDYDFSTGNAKKIHKIAFNFRKPESEDNLLPDGTTIDADGNIYVATFNGFTIYKIDPSVGKVLLEIKLPCKQITSAAFGGPNLDILYVTSAARGGLPAPSGTTFQITGLGVKGLPMTKLKL